MFSKIVPTLLINSMTKETGIHTWFVFGTIVVYWLNEDGVVVKKKVMRPFSIDSGCPAKYILEVPTDYQSYRVGEKISLSLT